MGKEVKNGNSLSNKIVYLKFCKDQEHAVKVRSHISRWKKVIRVPCTVTVFYKCITRDKDKDAVRP